MVTTDPPPVSPPSEQEGELSQTRRDIMVAGSILSLVAGALAFYIILIVPSTDDTEKRRDISAAAWVGENTENTWINSDAPIPRGEPSGDNRSHKTETRYAPTPEELSGINPEADSIHQRDASTGQIIKQGTVQKGTPVIKSLMRLGLSSGVAHALISALDGIYDFRKARPSQSFEVHIDADTQELIYFQYDVSITEIYEVKQKGGRLVGRRKRILTQKKARRYGGTIASSLYKALSEMDAHPSLSGRIVEVLAHEVDFYKAQRPGDTFRVLVEEESLDGTFIGYGPVEALEYIGVKSGKKRFFRFSTGNQNTTYYNEKGISVPQSVISIPLHYARISSLFGRRYHPILKRRRLHNGVDFAAPHGTHVWACQAGRVTCAARKGANGNLVIINHEDNLKSFYAHLQRFAAHIKSGVEVRERQVIGYVGSSGRSTGPHLHFGLKKDGRFVDPLKYKVRPGRRVAPRYRARLKAVIAEKGRQLDQTRILSPTSPLSKEQDTDEVLGLEDL
ncbi:MAG: M23 family metallopeptidase [Proteobacteria bacterium]|nr:M23 family metallopeptidase [Pseudomonadota bacterium]